MPFADMSDAALVTYAETHRDFAVGAAIEMQRRQIEATRRLHRTSTFQAWVMIALTVAILILTVVLVLKG